MNLINTFARIRKLFTKGGATTVRLIDVNAHMRRDLGFDNINSDRRVHEKAPRTETFVIVGGLTRAP